MRAIHLALAVGTVLLASCRGGSGAVAESPLSVDKPADTAADKPAGGASDQPVVGAGAAHALASVDIEMDEGRDGVRALARASARSGCKVQQTVEDGTPKVIAECAGGIFGAVQIDKVLSIRCVEMEVDACEVFVLSILDGAPAPSASPPP